MNSRKLFWSLTLVLAVFGFTAGSLVGHDEAPVIRGSEAVWKEVFRTPAEMVRNVDAIVLARVAGARPGRVAGSSKAGDALSFDRVELEVLRGFKKAASESRVFVERVGGEAARLEFDGGAFEPGATYLLFLRKQKNGPYYYQVNNQGRFLVVNNRLWASAPEDAVAGVFEGRQVGQGLGFIRKTLER
jgi:hypothetical protein